MHSAALLTAIGVAGIAVGVANRDPITTGIGLVFVWYYLTRAIKENAQ